MNLQEEKYQKRLKQSQQITKLRKMGYTVMTTCDQIGISFNTYYGLVRDFNLNVSQNSQTTYKKMRLKGGAPFNNNISENSSQQVIYVDKSENIKRLENILANVTPSASSHRRNIQ